MVLASDDRSLGRLLVSDVADNLAKAAELAPGGHRDRYIDNYRLIHAIVLLGDAHSAVIHFTSHIRWVLGNMRRDARQLACSVELHTILRQTGGQHDSTWLCPLPRRPDPLQRGRPGGRPVQCLLPPDRLLGCGRFWADASRAKTQMWTFSAACSLLESGCLFRRTLAPASTLHVAAARMEYYLAGSPDCSRRGWLC